MDNRELLDTERRGQQGPSSRRGNAKRILANCVYALFALMALSYLGEGAEALIQRNFAGLGISLAASLAAWYLGVGIGVRLGVSPIHFASTIGRVLGFSRSVAPEDTPDA